MAPHDGENPHYEPKDAVREGVWAAAITGSGGLFAAALQNHFNTKPTGALGTFTRYGSTTFYMTAVGGTYMFSRQATANLREKQDFWNDGVGGFLGGAVLGLKYGKISAVLGWGSLFGATLGAFEFTGGSLTGKDKDPERDEFTEKEKHRLNRRRPIEETIAEIGESPHVRPPGYEERRRQRLKERYGVDIKPVSADPDAPPP